MDSLARAAACRATLPARFSAKDPATVAAFPRQKVRVAITTDSGRPPRGGFARLVLELLVDDIGESLQFWREFLGFEIAYQRPEQGFAYLERPEGAQIMLCERSGKWETAPLEKPYGRGVML